jgi:phospholipid-binding lipoprotein MlaA
MHNVRITCYFLSKILRRKPVTFIADRPFMILRLFVLCLCILCTACATRSASVQTGAPAVQNHDPLEPYNRSVMKLNSGLTKILIKPVVTVYRALLPKPIRQAVANISSNAKAPLIFAHDVLQGEGHRATQTLGRFAMNSTVGLGGTFDIASKAGVPAHEEDAGQTFARWGVPAGPYLMLPLLGPSTFRDTAGFAADMFADPLRYVERGNNVADNVKTGLTIGGALTQLDQNVDRLGELQRGSVDPYIALREAYFQYRQAAIENGKPHVGKPGDDPLADVLDAPQ